MKKLLIFSLFFICWEHVHAAQQQVFVVGKDITEQAFTYELYCVSTFFNDDKSKVLEYVANPNNDIKKKFPGKYKIGDNRTIILFEHRLPILHRACMKKEDKDIVQALLARGDVDINECSLHGLTALHHACVDSSEEVVQLLLQHGADVNIVSNSDKTALTNACFRGKIHIATLLLSHQDIDITKGTVGDNETPLFFAATWGINLLNAFLASGKVSDHQKNNLNQTWFYVAWNYALLESEDFSSGDENYNPCNEDTVDVLHIFQQWNADEKKSFLNQELHALAKMHDLLTDVAGLRAFIQFCVKSGANVQDKNKKERRPLDNTYRIYRRLKKLVNAQSIDLIKKQHIFHALLLETPAITGENEVYATERAMALAAQDTQNGKR